MNIPRKRYLILAIGCAAVAGFGNVLQAEDAAKPADQKLELAEGKIVLTVSGDWKKVAPKSKIVEFEFSVPAVEGDDMPGRVTVMGAGGGIEANIDRWIAQFSQADGGDTKERSKISEETIAGQKLYVVDISGTYDDRPPFAGNGVMREKYRMLSLIIETDKAKKLGNYFVKFYGPEATVQANKAAFDALVKSLQVK